MEHVPISTTTGMHIVVHPSVDGCNLRPANPWSVIMLLRLEANLGSGLHDELCGGHEFIFTLVLLTVVDDDIVELE